MLLGTVLICVYWCLGCSSKYNINNTDLNWGGKVNFCVAVALQVGCLGGVARKWKLELL